MKRIITTWSLIAFFILAACQPITAPADTDTLAPESPLASLAAESPPQGDSYIDPDGRFSAPIPTNWTASTVQGFAVLQSPDGLIQVYIGALEAVEIEEAVAQAWRTVDPSFDLTPEETQEAPSRTGVDRTIIYTYDTEDTTPGQVVQAIAEAVDDLVYVTIVRGDIVEFGRRGAQVSIIVSGITLTGIEEVDLRGVTPQTLDDELLDELRAYIEDALPRFDVPGAAVAVVQNDEIVLLEGFGVRARGSDDPITPQTRMMIGSTGKTMTTMLLAHLVDTGQLTWDTPVQEILPQFAVADPELSANITVRNLVCACTGVPRRDLEFIFNANELSAEAVIESLRTFEFFTDFGEAFQYSNQLVATAGWVAAAAAGGEYGNLDNAYFDLIEAEIFDTIDMDATTFDFAEVIASDNYALPHPVNIEGTRTPTSVEAEEFLLVVAPAGASWTTADDMARYLLTELNQGVAPNGDRVVSTENLAVTWEPQVPVDATASYGLGWFVDEYYGQPMIHHGGNTTGFSADLAFLPEADLGIVVITNGQVTNPFNQAVRFRLLELAFDQPQEFDAVASFTNQEINRQMVGALEDVVSVDPATVTPYLGSYTNPALGAVDLTLVDEQLFLDVGEFVMEVQAMLDESGEITGYLTVSPPLLGLTLQFDTQEDDTVSMTLGEGVAQYQFTQTE